MNPKHIFSILLSCQILSYTGFSQTIDFSGAAIFLCEKKNIQLQKAVQVLQDEIQRRSNILLPVVNKPSGYKQVIVVVVEERMEKLPESWRAPILKLPETGREGFKIVRPDKNTVLIAGNDEPGALYGVGWLLRKMEIKNGHLFIPDSINFSSTPVYPIRGHQMGYRPKTNAYDAWSVAQFDEYIRDLVIFGANSIEIMPPRTDDDFSSIHMKLPAIKMISEQSRI